MLCQMFIYQEKTTENLQLLATPKGNKRIFPNINPERTHWKPSDVRGMVAAFLGISLDPVTFNKLTPTFKRKQQTNKTYMLFFPVCSQKVYCLEFVEKKQRYSKELLISLHKITCQRIASKTSEFPPYQAAR